MSESIEHALAAWGQASQIKYDEQRLVMLREFAHALDVQSWSVPVISITGTNGKGSTVAAIRTIYQTAGYRVGVYTSPHLMDIRERIAINDEWIDEQTFLRILKQIQAYPSRFELSYFEVLTLVALLYFKQENVDIVLLEVGMGGRLDAVNILDADVVVVTNVDLDHQAFLGETREEIAFEKAGLFRAHQHVVYADNQPCPQSMLKIAQALKVDLYRLDWEYGIQDYGPSQVHPHAISAAIQVAKILSAHRPIDEAHFEYAVEHCRVAGRQQWIDGPVPILLDVAHNPHGVRYLVDALQASQIRSQIHVVFSVLKDKDAHEIVKIVNKLNPMWYNCVLNVDRSIGVEEIKLLMTEQGQTAGFFQHAEHAFQAARDAAKAGDVIVAFGSFYLIEQIMQFLSRENMNVI